MIVFLLGWSRCGLVDPVSAQTNLKGYVEETPFFPGASEHVWIAGSGRFAAAWVAHDADRMGGVRYVATSPSRFALFSGRPIRWTGEQTADGRTPLNPEYYLGDPDRWSDTLDGRFFAARYDDTLQSLTVCTDPMGAYPVFRLTRGETVWFSNAPSLLRRMSNLREVELGVVADHVACGWSLDGNPWWRDVQRIERGTVATYTQRLPLRSRELLPVRDVASMYGRRTSVPVAARMIIASLRALADWPGRASLVPVTGGKDSRLVLPAAIAAGLDCEFVTAGTFERPDVVVAKRLCARVGVSHHLLPRYPYWSVEKDHLRAARVFAAVLGGLVTTADASGYPVAAVPDAPVLWHSGQGGEIARGFYGVGRGTVEAVAADLFGKVTGLRRGECGVLSRDALDTVRARVRKWVDDAADSGAACRDLPDLFYAFNRMPNWSAPGHGAVEFVRDTTSPLWSRRLLPYLVGASAVERSREQFHYRVLEVLDASLLEIPFAGDDWPTWHSQLAMRARMAASAVRRELMKRLGVSWRSSRGKSSEGGAAGANDPFALVMETTRDRVYSQRHHAAWAILDRPQVDELFRAPSGELTAAQKLSVWRLLDVFG